MNETEKKDFRFLSMIDMKMDNQTYVLYDLLFRSINSRTLLKNREVAVSLKRIKDCLNIETQAEIRDALHELQRQAVYEFKDVKDSPIEYSTIGVFESIKLNRAKSAVYFTFSESVAPLLSMMRKYYPYFVINDISKFKKKYSLILYKFLAMNYRRYIKIRNLSDQEEVEEYKNPTITISELREMTKTENDYQGSFSNFEKRVLKEPMEEINKLSWLNISYEKYRYDIAINKIKFYISTEFDDKPYKEVQL